MEKDIRIRIIFRRGINCWICHFYGIGEYGNPMIYLGNEIQPL